MLSYNRETQRKVTRLVKAVAEGQPPKSLLTQITTFERIEVRINCDGHVKLIEKPIITARNSRLPLAGRTQWGRG